VSDDVRSQHPIDHLIRDVIVSRRLASPEEIAEIVNRIATAPFDPQPDVPVLRIHRGLVYQGQQLGARASSLTYHLIKRVVDDCQWVFGTSAAEYLADLREAVVSPDARLVVYNRRGGSLAAILAQNRIPLARRGDGALPLILVVFSADRGTIITGYQASSATETNIPEDGLWLK
jgi:hypothetical protein